MLKLTTKVETLDIEVDGKTCHIPLEPTIKDLQGEAQKIFATPDTKPEDFSRWFISFLGEYIPHVEKLPVSALTAITEEWSAKSTLVNGTSAGE